MPPRKALARYPCIVASPFTHEEVDPRIKAAFEAHHQKAKFGDLRNIWRKRHCAELNPYGSEWCAYAPEDCAIAYLTAIQRSLAVSRTNPVGYFWRLANSMAQQRADDKPLARERETEAPHQPRDGPTSPQTGPGPVDTAVPSESGLHEAGLRRELSRPRRIGTLLGAFDFGPHQGRTDDGGGTDER